MRIDHIAEELAVRLRTTFDGTVYLNEHPDPTPPCMIVNLPTVSTFHVEYAHSVVTMEWEVEVYVPRGDIYEGVRQLGEFISTDTPQSVLVALEAKSDNMPWLRLRVERTDPFRTEGDTLGITFYVTIDA